MHGKEKWVPARKYCGAFERFSGTYESLQGEVRHSNNMEDLTTRIKIRTFQQRELNLHFNIKMLC